VYLDNHNKTQENNVTNKKQMIYILTFIRSGSTLLKAMMNNHPQIFAPAELHLLPFENLTDARQQFKGTILGRGVFEAAANLLGSKIEAKKKISEFEQKNTPISEIYQWFQSQLTGQYMVDKSPSYLMNLDILKRAEKMGAEQSNEPMYIVLKRHPFDLFDSLIDNNFHDLFTTLNNNYNEVQNGEVETGDSAFFTPYVKTPENPCQSALEIAEGSYINTMKNALLFLENIPKERRIELSYEELVINAEPEINRLCDFLKLPLDENMLTPYHAVNGQSTNKERVRDPNFHKHKSVNTKMRMKWKKNESWWSEQVLCRATVELSNRLGYELPNAYRSALTPAQAIFCKDNNAYTSLLLEMHYDLALENAHLDMTQLNQSLNHLAKIHPVLRSHLQKEDDNYFQYYEKELAADAIIYHDISDENEIAQITHIATLKSQEKAMISPSSSLLFRVLVLKTAEHNYHVVYLFHHLIVDGWAIQLFHKKLWQQYFMWPEKLLRQSKLSMDTATEMFFLEDSYDLAKSKAKLQPELAASGQWSTQLLANKALNTVNSLKEQRCQLRIEVSRPKYNFHQVAMALYHTIGELDKTSTPVLAHRFHRRKLSEKYNFEDQLGWLAGDAPIGINLQHGATDSLKEFKQKLKNQPLKGTSYDWLYLKDEVPALHSVCPIRLNYYPMRDFNVLAGAKFSNVEISLHQDQSAQRDYIIDFIVRDYKSTCTIYVRYSSAIISQNEIKSLMNKWLNNFEALGLADNYTMTLEELAQ
jgi:hypothetical protein